MVSGKEFEKNSFCSSDNVLSLSAIFCMSLTRGSSPLNNASAALRHLFADSELEDLTNSRAIQSTNFVGRHCVIAERIFSNIVTSSSPS